MAFLERRTRKPRTPVATADDPDVDDYDDYDSDAYSDACSDGDEGVDMKVMDMPWVVHDDPPEDRRHCILERLIFRGVVPVGTLLRAKAGVPPSKLLAFGYASVTFHDIAVVEVRHRGLACDSNDAVLVDEEFIEGVHLEVFALMAGIATDPMTISTHIFLPDGRSLFQAEIDALNGPRRCTICRRTRPDNLSGFHDGLEPVMICSICRRPAHAHCFGLRGGKRLKSEHEAWRCGGCVHWCGPTPIPHYNAVVASAAAAHALH